MRVGVNWRIEGSRSGSRGRGIVFGLFGSHVAALEVMERENVILSARRLAADGAGVIYVGHNLVEILEVADGLKRPSVYVNSAGWPGWTGPMR